MSLLSLVRVGGAAGRLSAGFGSGSSNYVRRAATCSFSTRSVLRALPTVAGSNGSMFKASSGVSGYNTTRLDSGSMLKSSLLRNTKTESRTFARNYATDEEADSNAHDVHGSFFANIKLLNKEPPSSNRGILALPVQRPIFPGSIGYVVVTNEELIKILQKNQASESPVAVFTPKSTNSDTNVIETESDLNKIGVICKVLRINVARHVDGKIPHAEVILGGARRVAITKLDSTNPIIVDVHPTEEEPYNAYDKEIRALYCELLSSVREVASLQATITNFASNFNVVIDHHNPDDLSEFADHVATYTVTGGPHYQEFLEALDIKERLKKAITIIKGELQVLKLQQSIRGVFDDKPTRPMKKIFLLEQLKAIKKELGMEHDDKTALLSKYQDRLNGLVVPEHAMKVIRDELSKLSSLEPMSSEYNLTRSYVDWLTQIPWGVYSEDKYDLEFAKKVLDEDHYGLKDIKERILEFIAVASLNSKVQGKILCFVGPPGVGKTSIGKSIARALNRQFYRFSVGGLRDVAEIKGHRRTYVGSLPGKLIHALKMVKTSNPVILIDEIDKMGASHQGDPASALLEVLDPEQNADYVDHYLDVPVDLSKVLFLCTANVADTIPGPLLDRMEVIRLSGYVLEEKLAIAQKYLEPTAMQSAGLKKKNVNLDETALRTLIRSYCREAGVRNLQKHIEKIFRRVALKVVEGEDKKLRITDKNLKEFVGIPIFSSDRFHEQTPVGVVMGLAWTSMGGATLYIETVVEKQGKDGITVTGQLGDVMKESAKISFTYSKSFLDKIAPGNNFFDNATFHMHIPEGATPKDGPSAGITMVTSLISLAINKPVVPDLAMTGELTLTGKVLTIGGVKEKTIAAKRSGVKHIIFPKDNQKDFDELADYIKEGLTVFYADTYMDVYNIVFKTESELAELIKEREKHQKKGKKDVKEKKGAKKEKVLASATKSKSSKATTATKTKKATTAKTTKKTKTAKE